MRGHKDSIEWDEDREKYFLELLSERVRKDPNGSLIFKGTEWKEMDDEIYVKFGLRYGQHKLKGKYHHLRSMHKKFCELINDTGVTWDSLSGKVLANDTVWDDLLCEIKFSKLSRKMVASYIHYYLRYLVALPPHILIIMLQVLLLKL